MIRRPSARAAPSASAAPAPLADTPSARAAPASRARPLAGTPYGRLPLLVIGAIFFVQVFDSAAFVVAGPDIARELDVDVLDIVEIQALIGVLTVVAAIAVGYVADRTRRVPFLSVGTVLSGLFSVLSGRAGGFGPMAAARVADDVAGEAQQVPQFSLVADYYPPEARGRVFAMFGALANIARVSSVVVVGWMVTQMGFRTTFVVVGAPLVALGILAQVVLPEPVRGFMERRARGLSPEAAAVADPPLSLGESFRATFRPRTVRRLFAGSVVAGIGARAVALFFPFFLADTYGLDAFERSLVLVPGVVAGVAGAFLGGRIVDRSLATDPAYALMALSGFSVVAAGGVAGFAAEPAPWLVAVAAAALGFGASLAGPARLSVLSNVVAPSIRTTGLQFVFLSEIPSLLLAASVGGYLRAEYGYPGVFLAAVPLLVLGAAIDLSAASHYDGDMQANLTAATAGDRWRSARSAGDAPALAVSGLTVTAGGVPVVDGVSFEVAPGTVLALVGDNGAGQSTVLQAVAGLTPSAGTVIAGGRDITTMPPHEIARHGVALVPGESAVVGGCTVAENLQLAARVSGGAGTVPPRLRHAFAVLGDRMNVPASELSGGERRQLALAMATVAEPQVLLVDELSLGLSAVATQAVVETIDGLRRAGMAVVVVEQYLPLATDLADVVLVMADGRVVDRFDGRGGTRTARPRAASGHVPVRAARPLGELVLEVEGVARSYGGVTGADEVSFRLHRDEVLGIAGPNGAGKTTLLDLISGHQRPDRGRILLDGRDVTREPAEVRARLGMVRRFQDPGTFPSLTVHDAVTLAASRGPGSRGAVSRAAVSRGPAGRRAAGRVDELLELVGLTAVRTARLDTLAPGIRRMVDLAMVLAAEPRVLLLDEPSASLAQRDSESVPWLLDRIRRETGCATIVVEHDLDLLAAVSDRLLVIGQGAVLADGPPAVVLENPIVAETLFGPPATEPVGTGGR